MITRDAAAFFAFARDCPAEAAAATPRAAFLVAPDRFVRADESAFATLPAPLLPVAPADEPPPELPDDPSEPLSRAAVSLRISYSSTPMASRSGRWRA